MKRLVLSGINLFAGGTLEIYKKFIEELGRCGYDKKYAIVAFVHKKELFDGIPCRVRYIEIPDGRNYLRRMYYEQIFFKRWSKGKNIDVWIAMHDLTPRVIAKRRFTYYHTPQIFYDMPLYKAVLDPRCFLRSKFYKYFVNLNIRKTTGIIVQAEWIKTEFGKIFKGCNIIIARPEETEREIVLEEHQNESITFFYPSFPRVFKNFEVICEACKRLNKKGYQYKTWMTVRGNENRYSKWLYKKYADVENIEWLGVQDRDVIERLYREADILIFPSTLETWGLPITEWGKYAKPMLLADYPYAHETARDEEHKIFFEANDSKKLAKIMAQAIKGECMYYESASAEKGLKRDEWEMLLELLLD